MIHTSEFNVRNATQEDVPSLVAIDMATFNSVYASYATDPSSLRYDLEEKFAHRINLLGGEWTSVLERNGKPVGLMTSCPTSKTPESFVSWEDTTDNGTLDTTYDQNGKNLYTTTLSVLPEGSPAKGMLFAHQIGQGLRDDYTQAFFESRIPGLRSWVGTKHPEVDALSKEQLDVLANEYFNLTNTVGETDVPYDRLLRLYHNMGCKLLKLIPNAYNDTPSMNYGVLCTYNFEEQLGNITSPKLAQHRSVRWLAGTALRAFAHSNLLTRKIL